MKKNFFIFLFLFFSLLVIAERKEDDIWGEIFFPARITLVGNKLSVSVNFPDNCWRVASLFVYDSDFNKKEIFYPNQTGGKFFLFDLSKNQESLIEDFPFFRILFEKADHKINYYEPEYKLYWMSLGSSDPERKSYFWKDKFKLSGVVIVDYWPAHYFSGRCFFFGSKEILNSKLSQFLP